MHSLEIRGAEQNSNFDESITDSREPESITELRRQNERLHIDAAKAVTLYGNARVIMPKIPHSRNGFIASIRDASSPVKYIYNITYHIKTKRHRPASGCGAALSEFRPRKQYLR